MNAHQLGIAVRKQMDPGSYDLAVAMLRASRNHDFLPIRVRTEGLSLAMRGLVDVSYIFACQFIANQYGDYFDFPD